MLVYAIILLGVAALVGLVMAVSVLRGKLAPWVLSLLHLALGGAALFLVFQSLMGGESRVMLPFAVLGVAALGGLYLASIHLKKRAAPKGVVLVHAGLGAVGFALLVTMVYIHNLTF